MTYQIRDLLIEDFPALLTEINDPPKSLRVAGILPPLRNKLLCVVGSRRHTQYGKEACEYLIAGLAGLPISIVSGLAYGIDSIAHEAALAADIHTVAIPGSGLDPKLMYPRAHLKLAERIVESGGALLSEFADDLKAADWTFPRRNRIMAGMCHATLVIEAETKSGTLITSKLATEYNRDVLALPGSIFSSQSDGPHMLLRLGATLVRTPEDIMEILGFTPAARETKDYEPENETEEAIMTLLSLPKSRDEIIRESELPTHIVTSTLAVLEIKGVITESMGEIRLN